MADMLEGERTLSMDLWTALRVIARHWIVLAIGLMLTAGTVLLLNHRLVTQYSASGTVIVIQRDNNSNPLTRLSSTTVLGALFASTLTTTSGSAADVQSLGGTASYSLAGDPNVPIVTITTTSTDPAAAVSTIGIVSQVMNNVLRDQQFRLGAPKATWLEVLPLDTPTGAAPTTGKNKVLGIAGALGVLAAVSLTFVAEAIAYLRRRRLPRVESEVATVPWPVKSAAVPRAVNGQPAEAPRAVTAGLSTPIPDRPTEVWPARSTRLARRRDAEARMIPWASRYTRLERLRDVEQQDSTNGTPPTSQR